MAFMFENLQVYQKVVDLVDRVASLAEGFLQAEPREARLSDAPLDNLTGKITLPNAILSLAAASVRGGYIDAKGLDLA
ncbi:MAG: hypothetical protein KAV00_16810, partial [Phycisphaerae bacterium]|nr:hypothetical protein [Phycisphaerae bacterium]